MADCAGRGGRTPAVPPHDDDGVAATPSTAAGSFRPGSAPACSRSPSPPASSPGDDEALLGSPASSAMPSPSPSPPPPPSPRPSLPTPPLAPPRRRLATAFAIVAVASLLSADQQLMAPNLTAIAADLGLPFPDRDRLLGGVVAALFFAVGAPAALVAGHLSARCDRVRLLACLVLLGEGPCLATAWVRSYGGLLATRILTGLSAGGLPPLLYSLLADLVGPAHRAAASAGVQLAVSGGAAGGQLLAGVMGPRIGWRAPFVVVAVPALVAAAVMVATVADPPRGGMDGGGGGGGGQGSSVVVAASHQDGPAAAAAATPPPPPPPQTGGPSRAARARAAVAAALATSASVLAIPSAAAAILQGGPGSLPWGVFGTFFADYLAVDRGMSLARASGLLAAWGLGGAAGVVAGGLAGQALHNAGRARTTVQCCGGCGRRRGRRQTLAWPLGRGAMPAAAGAAVAAATGPALFLVRRATGTTPAPLLAALAAVGGLTSCAAGPAIRAVLLNVTSPSNRGVALALQTVLDDVGRGAGPFLVAKMSAAWGRPRAFTVAVAMWAPCGALIAAAGVTLARDEDRAAASVGAAPCCAMVVGSKQEEDGRV